MITRLLHRDLSYKSYSRLILYVFKSFPSLKQPKLMISPPSHTPWDPASELIIIFLAGFCICRLTRNINIGKHPYCQLPDGQISSQSINGKNIQYPELLSPYGSCCFHLDPLVSRSNILCHWDPGHRFLLQLCILIFFFPHMPHLQTGISWYGLIFQQNIDLCELNHLKGL